MVIRPKGGKWAGRPTHGLWPCYSPARYCSTRVGMGQLEPPDCIGPLFCGPTTQYGTDETGLDRVGPRAGGRLGTVWPVWTMPTGRAWPGPPNALDFEA